MRSSTVVRVAVVVLSLAGAGCGAAATTLSCTPSCPTGFRCSERGCQPEGALGPPDLAATSDGDGRCRGACSAPAPFCNDAGLCVPCLVDTDCPAGEVCRLLGRASVCLPGCSAQAPCSGAASCCGGACVDAASDPHNCGGCGLECRAPQATGACGGGHCALGACAVGWADCDGDPIDGCEAPLASDARNCGACGSACALPHATAGCATACYVVACNFGWADCDGDAADGCEQSVLADKTHCGGCDVACGAAPHARVGCAEALCQLTACDAGWADCDGAYPNGCEVAIGTDVNNCGACGLACAHGQVCKNGGCTCPQCNFPNARSACVNQVCALGACNPGWGDCDGKPDNGCETPTLSDPENCGGCGHACPNNAPACNMGQCTAYFGSCLAVLQAGKAMGDGVYSIDPGGGPLQVYCDMESDGGGWTLVHKNDLSGTGDRTDDGWNQAALLDPTVNSVAVLPRDTIAAISPASEFRVLGTNGYAIYSLGGMPYYTTDNHLVMMFAGGQLKYAWADPYVDQMSPILPFPQHATLVCPSVNGCSGGDTGHLAVQRFCCGAPNAGFWFNGQGHFVAGYYAGAGWVR